MKIIYRVLAVMTVAVVLLSANQDASAQVRLGSHAGLNFDGTNFLIGVNSHFAVNIGDRQLLGSPSADFYLFQDDLTFGETSIDVSQYRINLDVLYPFNLGSNNIDPFIGGGLAIIITSLDLQSDIDIIGLSSSDSDIGLNLRVGTFFGNPDSAFRPFVDGNITLGDNTDFAIRGGATFRITN